MSLVVDMALNLLPGLITRGTVSSRDGVTTVIASGLPKDLPIEHATIDLHTRTLIVGYDDQRLGMRRQTVVVDEVRPSRTFELARRVAGGMPERGSYDSIEWAERESNLDGFKKARETTSEDHALVCLYRKAFAAGYAARAREGKEGLR